MLKHWLSAAEFMEKSQFRMFQGPVWAWASLGYLNLGMIDKARQYAEKGLEMHMDLGMNVWLGSIHSVLSEIYLSLGKPKEALRYAEKGVELCQKTNEKHFESESRMSLGRAIAATETERLNEAQEQVLLGVDILDKLQIKPRYAVGSLYLGELCAQALRKESAVEHMKKAESMFREMGMDYWLCKAQESLAAL